jgi:drug/metabolite transporter (DMT)-like permease
VTSRQAVHDRIDVLAGTILVVCCLIWGVQQAAIKISLDQGIPPLMQATLRSSGAAILLALWAAVRGQWRTLFARDGSALPLLLIIVLFAGEFLTLYPGLQRTTASRGVVVLYTAPFWVAIGAHFFVPGEFLRPGQLLGLLAAFVGVGCAVADGLRGGGGSLLGDALVGMAAAFWGATTVVIKASPPLQRLPAVKILLFQLAGSVPILFAVAGASGELHVSGATATAWAWMLYQTVIVAAGTYLVFVWLIAHYPAGRLSSYTFLTPLFGILAGAGLLGERVSPALILALVFVAAGIRLVNGPAPARGIRSRPREASG